MKKFYAVKTTDTNNFQHFEHEDPSIVCRAVIIVRKTKVNLNIRIFVFGKCEEKFVSYQQMYFEKVKILK